MLDEICCLAKREPVAVREGPFFLLQKTPSKSYKKARVCFAASSNVLLRTAVSQIQNNKKIE